MAQSRHAQCADECPLLNADIDNRCLPISICEHTARSNGETVHLADLKGKMVVLEWTNDGCQRCRAPGALLESDLLISQRFDCSAWRPFLRTARGSRAALRLILIVSKARKAGVVGLSQYR
jgi:hypothetical protein